MSEQNWPQFFVLVRFPREWFRSTCPLDKGGRGRNSRLADAAGIDTIRGITISADAKAYVYGYIRSLSDLYLVEGLKRSQTKLGPARSCFRQPGDSSFDVLLIRSPNVGL